MMPYIQENADTFIKCMEKYANSGEEVHILRKFEELSMDYVARGSFGIDERFQGKPDHPAIAIAKSTLRGAMTGPVHFTARECTSVPLLASFISTACLIKQQVETLFAKSNQRFPDSSCPMSQKNLAGCS